MSSNRSPFAAALNHLVAAVVLAIPLAVAQLVAFKLITWTLFIGEICSLLTAAKFIGVVMQRLPRVPGDATKTIGASVGVARRILMRFLIIPAFTFGLHYITRIFVPGDVLEPLVSFGCAAAIFGWVDKALEHRMRFEPSQEKGTKLEKAEAVERKAKTLVAKADEPRVRWGPMLLPNGIIKEHFCVVGTPGSGKTLILRHMMQSIIPHIGRIPDWRAIVYDPQRNFIPLLDGMGLNAPLVVMNPFDSRSVAWDMAEDVTTPTSALQVASILIPERDDEGSNKHFTETARALLAGVLNALHLTCPGRWTLRDVLLIATDAKVMMQVLESSKYTKRLVDSHLGPSDKNRSNYITTLSTAVELYYPIAAMWARARKRLSLREWVKTSSVLVLGNDPAARKEIDAINRVIFQRLSELLLQQPDSAHRRSWIVLDEAREAGDLRGLNSLLVTGRAKGVRVALGFQDIDGLRSVYGKERANELVGVCGTRAFLRLDSDVTAQWASDVIGSWQGTEVTQSYSEGTITQNEHIVKREAVLASELLNLPAVDTENGRFEGFYSSPHLGKFSATFSFLEGLRPPGKMSAFEARPDEDQYIEPFEDSDLERLKLKTITEPEDEGGAQILEMPPGS